MEEMFEETCMNVNDFSKPCETELRSCSSPLTPSSMQEERKSEYMKLLNLRESTIVVTNQNSDCERCFNSIKVGQGIVLHQCGHTFCLHCLKGQILRNNGSSDIKCPFNKGEDTCQFFIEENEIKALLTKAQYEERTSVLFKTMPDAVHCMAVGCGDIIIAEGQIYHFTCPTCKSVNCLDCNKIHPDGGTCRLTADLSTYEEKLKSFENWKNLTEDALVENTEAFECVICLVECGLGEGVVLKNCIHTFCKDCLKNHIKLADDAEITCPFRNEDYACEGILEQREIKALLTLDEHEEFLSNSVKLAESTMKNSFHCLTPDCDGWCVLEDHSFFECPICNHLNCSACEAIHDDLTCRQYKESLLEKSKPEKEEDIRQSEVALKRLVQTGLAMQCTSCGATVEKIDGCDSIVCKCKTALCWATKGPRWGPRGTGDTSGGCRCLVNGIKCHPSCTNCH